MHVAAALSQRECVSLRSLPLSALRPRHMAAAAAQHAPAPHPHVSHVLYSEEVIAKRVKELGVELSKDYAECAAYARLPRLR